MHYEYDENDDNRFEESIIYRDYEEDDENIFDREKDMPNDYEEDDKNINIFGRRKDMHYDYEEDDENMNIFGRRKDMHYDYEEDDENRFGRRKDMHYDYEEDDENIFGRRKDMHYNYEEDDENIFGRGKDMHYDYEEDDENIFGKRKDMYYDYEEDDENIFGKGKDTYYDYDDDDFDEDDDGNKFGKSIPYRKGKAIQLVKYENGEIILIKESLEIIQKIEEPVAIISVVGSYRRGKSYFANVLHGRHDGFELGSKVDSCTKGIFMWDTPFLHNDYRVIVLDCEGIDDPKQDEIWAMKLFILCLAISSTFIYNINGVVGRDDVGKLYTMTDLSKFLLKSEDNEKDYLPSLVVLLRDFGLEDPDNFRDYFLEKLSQVDSDAATGITRQFKDFDVYALPHPGCKRQILHELERVRTSQLDPDFISNMSHAVSEIYDSLSSKQINSKSLTGISFSKFLQDCIQHMNLNTNDLNALSLPNQYNSLINFMSRLAIDVGFTHYSTMMTTKSIKDFPLSWETFNDEHTMLLSKADFLFTEKLIGNYSQTLNTRNEFEELIENERKTFAEKNSEMLKNYNLNLANSLWRVHIKPGLTADYLFEGHVQFNNALDTFMQEYTDKSFKGREAMEIYTQFKDQETNSAQETLDRMFKLRDTIKSVKDAHQELVNQIDQSKERLNQLLEENNQEEHEFNEQIEKLVSNIDELNLQLSKLPNSD